MLARPSQHLTSESWYGHWGIDARFYARRGDGACFAIDPSMNVIDLAGTTPPEAHARPVESLPRLGRYTLSVFAVRSAADDSATSPDAARDVARGAGERPSEGSAVASRLLAYGVRRRVPAR
jgi:hypothetical protein